MPYFLSKPITEAITTDEQSVSGMKPIFTSSSSGLSEPAAHAPPAEHRAHCSHTSKARPGLEKAAAGKNLVVELLAHRSPLIRKYKKAGVTSPPGNAGDGRPCPSEIA
jgi:hypothetical protein